MIIKLQPKKWVLVYYASTGNKYAIHLIALSDDTGEYPELPVSVVEKGKPGKEVYIATYANMDRQHFISIPDLAFYHNSAIESFETLEDYN